MGDRGGERVIPGRAGPARPRAVHRRAGAPARPRWPDVVVPALPVAAVTLAMLAVARNGAYAGPDSAFYVGLARSLRDSLDFIAPPGSQPLAHFPPLFPVVLAASSAVLGADPLGAAGVVNPLLTGATAGLVGLVVWRRTASVRAGALAAAVVGLARESLVYGASALSEPLFTLLALGALVALAASISTGSRRMLGGAAALVGLACLTRYAAAALLVTGVAAILRFEGASGRRRALAFAAGASAPLAVWLAVVGRTNRHVAFHPFDLEYWAAGADAASKWVAPAFLPWPARAVVAAAAVASWRAARPRIRLAHPAPERRAGDPLPFVLGAFAVAYLSLLVADRVLLDDSGRLDGRFLLPLRGVAVLGLAPVLHRVVTARVGRTGRRPAARAVAAGGAVLVALHAVQAAAWAVTGLGDDSLGRRGLAARAWSESTVMAVVAALPPSVPVYTDGPDAVFLHTGRRARILPAHRDLLTGRTRPAYERELDAMERHLRRTGGVVAYFEPFAFRSQFLPTPSELAGAVRLTAVERDGIGVLYRVGP